MNALLTAIFAHNWTLTAAIVVGGVVALAKQGYLSAWLAKKLPPAALPYLSVALGVLGLGASEIVAGTPWQQAILDGIKSGILAVFGHEVGIESLRRGRELIPSKLPKEPS